MTTPKLDPDLASDGRLDAASLLSEPRLEFDAAATRPIVVLPPNGPTVKIIWHLDSNISWYGPGFYGHNGACGMVPGGIQKDTVGVAHRTLPCGTKVTFRYKGHTVVTQVIDRGPYVSGRTWDMTRGLCAAPRTLLHRRRGLLQDRVTPAATRVCSAAWTAGGRSSSRSGSTRSSRSG